MLKPPPDFNERAYQLKVQGDISHDVDLVALLRSHLNIEQCLDRVILHNVPDGKPLLDFLQFSQKLTVITEHEWVPKPLCALIARINVIRNRFSHDRDDQHFTPEDEHAFRSIVGSFKYHEKFPDK